MTWRDEMVRREYALVGEVLKEGLRPRSSGFMVTRLEHAFSEYVGAKHAIAMTNGTVTLEAALRACGVAPGHEVGVPPLTMSATCAAVISSGCAPMFLDVDGQTWVMGGGQRAPHARVLMSVSLFGLEERAGFDYRDAKRMRGQRHLIVDAAQTLQKHEGKPYGGYPDFTSYSFQSSKIISGGEGGMLVTNDAELAARARSYASLGYDVSADSRIDRMAIRDPNAIRHVRIGINGRMNDVTAAVVLAQLEYADELLAERLACAMLYREAHQGCTWLTPQHVPEGSSHSWWCYPLLLNIDVKRKPIAPEPLSPYWTTLNWRWFAERIVHHGGEKPYAAWRLTFDESAFKHLDPGPDACPVARSIQPRLTLFQTNDLAAAERNATALHKAIEELGG